MGGFFDVEVGGDFFGVAFAEGHGGVEVYVVADGFVAGDGDGFYAVDAFFLGEEVEADFGFYFVVEAFEFADGEAVAVFANGLYGHWVRASVEPVLVCV